MLTHTIRGAGGIQLVIHEYGNPNGKPILFIHGISQSHLSWCKQYESDLVHDFRLICPDMRGHGMSEKPLDIEQYTSGEKWADDIHAIIVGLSLEKPVMVGWSYGGFVVNDYLAKFGQTSIGGINYLSAGALMGMENAADKYGAGFTDQVPGMCSDELEINIRAIRPFLHAVFEKQPNQEEFEIMLAYNMCVPPVVRLGLVSRIIDGDFVMRALQIPVLISWGTRDRVVSASHTNYIRSCIPYARYSEYQDIGHAPHFEASVRFNHEIAEFARECAGKGQL